MGTAVVNDLKVGIYDGFPQARMVDGVLGLDFLRRFKVTVDTTAGVMRLEPRPAR